MAKRKPSGYNLFIKKCMGENSDKMKGQPFGASAPFMKECASKWKDLDTSQKESYKDLKDKCELVDDKWECPIEP